MQQADSLRKTKTDALAKRLNASAQPTDGSFSLLPIRKASTAFLPKIRSVSSSAALGKG